jgi:hypothetical protein
MPRNPRLPKTRLKNQGLAGITFPPDTALSAAIVAIKSRQLIPSSTSEPRQAPA